MIHRARQYIEKHHKVIAIMCAVLSIVIGLVGLGIWQRDAASAKATLCHWRLTDASGQVGPFVLKGPGPKIMTGVDGYFCMPSMWVSGTVVQVLSPFTHLPVGEFTVPEQWHEGTNDIAYVPTISDAPNPSVFPVSDRFGG